MQSARLGNRHHRTPALGPPPPPNSGRQWYCTGPRLKKELRQARWFAAQDCPEGYRPAVQCLPVGDPCVLLRARRAVLSEAHLRRILKKYATYYNALRTHRSLNKDAPRGEINQAEYEERRRLLEA
jgi:hypothetical protein